MKTLTRRLAALLLAFAFIIWDMPQIDLRSSAAIFAGGSGTAEDPYQISTADQLMMIYIYNSKYFQLMNDIDLSGRNLRSGILGEHTIFKGHFDGNGHTISGVNIYAPDIDNVAQSPKKTDFYTNTGNISNPLMTLAVMEKLSPNERMILFFSFVIFALNLNAHHAR